MYKNKNISAILSIVKEKPEIGKTAMMKLVYMLQEVYDLNFGYEYDIYTYGPYAPEVMADIDHIAAMQEIKLDTYDFNYGKGYSLTITEKGEEAISDLDDFTANRIKQAVDVFGNKTAKQLELDSTIIYFKKMYDRNKWNGTKSSIVEAVNEIKPHFTEDDIAKAFDNLLDLGIV